MQANEARQLFDYLIDTRTRFLEKCREVGWEEFAKNREASWESMLGIYLHIFEVEDSWLHYAFRGLSPLEARSYESSEYKEYDQLSELNSKMSAKTRALLANLADEDLAKEVAFRESNGITKRIANKILMHAFVDELAHIGEIICLLWQLDVKPPYIDWLDYQLG